MDEIVRSRHDYEGEPFDVRDAARTWLEQFRDWFDRAVEDGVPEPNAMVLATADEAGKPSARTVLLRGLDERGLVFYTNLRSPKARDLNTNPVASLVFAWIQLHRQIVISGSATSVSAAEADAYWASRPIESRVSAIASSQSRVVESRAVLEDAWRTLGAQPVAVARPPYWGAFRVVPDAVEFWQGRRHRLHDRIRYRHEGSRWIIERLSP